MQYPDYKPALESPPLSDDDLQALDSLLRTDPAKEVRQVAFIDSKGNIYILDGGNDCIRKLSVEGVVSTVARRG